MKKIIITLFAIIISISCYSQKKDTLPKYDTVYVFAIQDILVLKNLLMESKLISNGNQFTGKDLIQLFDWIDKKGKLIKKLVL